MLSYFFMPQNSIARDFNYTFINLFNKTSFDQL